MNHTYLFHLGHCPDLSHAEILAVADRLCGTIHVQRRLDSVTIAEGTDIERIREFCRELGGTIRLCEIQPFEESRQFDPSTLPSSLELFNAIVSAKIDEALIAQHQRPRFGFSILNDSKWPGNHKKLIGLLHDTASLLKNHLREKDYSSRFVSPDPEGKTACLSGAQIDKNAMMQKGGEIVFHLHADTGLTLGLTRWIQPYEDYSKRDYGRPQRDAKQGMLPPKLARITINLARTGSTRSLLDPFCGSGSILTEAGLMGLDATGFDINQRAIQSSIGNWTWLQEKISQPTGTLRAIQGDARSLHTLCEPLYFDACATEPYLGPPQRAPLNRDQFDRLSSELTPLYLRALGEIRCVVKPGARVVFLVPRFRMKEEENSGSLALLKTIKLQGYTLLDPFAGFQAAEQKSTLLYSRPNQIVQREVYVLKA